ncbi:CDP-glycerol glycerophosphotransferase family protein, partial [Heyndrickxia sporothermodurans]
NEIRSIFHIATSRYIIIDNYFGFLSTIHFKKNVECIQLWHAVGAFKKFGLKDHTFEDRPISDKKRILKVYKQFHKIVVGSDKMAAIFMAAFNVDRKNILPTGIPRTDLFFDDMKKRTIAFDWLKDYPTLENKKIIMYAPTFRDNELKNFKLHLDLFLLQKKLGEEYAIILKLHPAISNEKNYVEKYPGFVYDFSSYKDVNKLLIITDI